MIKLLVGHKGSGKTKKMVVMANEAAKTSKGNVVVVEKGIQLTYDLSYQVRLVDVEQFIKSSCKGFDFFIRTSPLSPRWFASSSRSRLRTTSSSPSS